VAPRDPPRFNVSPRPPTVTAAPHHGAALFQLWQRGARWGSMRRRARGGGALMRYSQLKCLSTASARSRCSSYIGEDDQVPRGDLRKLISRGPPGTPSPSPIAVSMSPWLSRSTWTCSSRNPFVHSQPNHQQGAHAQCRAGNGDQRSRCQGACSGGQQLTWGINGHRARRGGPASRRSSPPLTSSLPCIAV